MKVHYTSKSDLYETPVDFFARLAAEFLFTLDVCATSENAKCDRFFTREDPQGGGLLAPWKTNGGAIWMNPPYGDTIGVWVGRAVSAAEHGETVVCLIPARTDTSWWHVHVLAKAAEIRFVRGRLAFADKRSRAPFPSALVVFRHGHAGAPLVTSIDNGRKRRMPPSVRRAASLDRRDAEVPA